MTTRLVTITVTLLAVLTSTYPAEAQGTAFTYQGRLNVNGSPVTGVYDFQFSIYDSSGAGALVAGPLLVREIGVTNGLFTVSLDFGVGVFTGAERWLGIELRTAGGSAFTTLGPRQSITPTPYAITAANLSLGANPTFTGTPSFNAPGGPPFNVMSPTKVANLNADLLDGLDSAALVLKAGDTMSGSLTIANPATLNFGSSVRQMVNLWGNVYGVGVQAAALYFRSDDGFAWFRDGVHANGTFDPGAGGTAVMTLSSTGNLQVNSTGATAIRGATSSAGGNGVVGEANNGSGAFGVWGISASGFAGHFDGAVRVNYASPFNKAHLELKDPSNAGFARLRLQTGTRPLWDMAVGTSINTTNTLRFYSDGNGDVMMLQPDGQLSANSLAVPATGTALMKLSNAGAVLNNGLPVILHSELTGSGAAKDLIFIHGSGVTARIGVRNSPSDGILTRARQHSWEDQNNQQMMSLGRNVQGLPVLNVGDGIVSCGTVFETSDRDLKENFAEVEPQATLDKVLSLPVSTWNFKGVTTARHMGPMAQDFQAAFGLGLDDKHLATRDLAAVALAAIQGLNQKLQHKETEIAELRGRLEKLERLLNHTPNGGAK